MWLGLLCGIAAAWAGTTAPRAFVLDNGLRVAIQRDARAPLVAVAMSYDVGSVLDGETSGLAHLVEHLAFAGSPHAPDGAFDALLEGAGGTSDGLTRVERLTLTMRAPGEALDLALFLESDRMLGLSAGPAALEAQRAIVLQELAEAAASPERLLVDAVAAARWGEAHPLGRPPRGDVAGIAAITLADVADFWSAWTGPGNAALAIVGDLDPAEVEVQVRRWFADVPARPPPPRPPLLAPRPPAAPPALVSDTATPSLTLLWPTPPRGHADEAAYDVLAELLGEVSGRGRVGIEVRAAHQTLRAGGTLSARAIGHLDANGASARRPYEATAQAIRARLARLARDGASNSELVAARRRLEAAQARALEPLVAQADELAACLLQTGEPGCASRLRAAWAAVEAEDIRRVAAALGEPLSIWSGPAGHERAP